MPIKIGYRKSESAAMVAGIKAQVAALVADLPSEPLGPLTLVCCCSNCIDDVAYGQLTRMSPREFTSDMVGEYFGGAGAVEVETNERDQLEARVIFTHVLWHVVDAVTTPDRNEERRYSLTRGFIDPNY